MSSSSRNPSKWKVAIKVINDDFGIEQITGLLDVNYKSPNYIDTSRCENYRRSRIAPLIQHKPDMSTLVSSTNDDICKSVSVPEKTIITPKCSSVAGVKWQRRKKRSRKGRRRASFHKQNKHCNGETSPDILDESLMSIEDKAAPPMKNMEILENNGVNKLPDKQEINFKPQFIKTCPVKLLDKVVTNDQPAIKVNDDASLKDRSYVWIQEITESPSILEILKLFPYNSINENSCEISQHTDLVCKDPKSLFSLNTSNSISVDTVQQIYENTISQLHGVEQKNNTSPLECASSKITTARNVRSLTSANNDISKTPLKTPKLDISCGRTHSSAVSVQQQQIAKGTSPSSTDIEALSKCKPLPNQQPTKGTSPSSTDIEALSKCKPLPNQQPTKGTSPSSTDIEVLSKGKPLPNQQSPKWASPSSTDIETLPECQSLQQQQPPKGTSPSSTDIEGLPDCQSLQQQQPPKGTSPSSKDTEALSKSSSSNDTFVKNLTFPQIKMVAVDVENLGVNYSKSPNLRHPSPTLMSNSLVDKNTKHSWRKTKSYPHRKKTRETEISTKVVQKFKNVKKILSGTDLTKKLQSGRIHKSHVVLTGLSTALTERLIPDLIDSNAIMTKKSTSIVVEKSAPDLIEKSSPLLVRKFKFHRTNRSNFALRKRHMPYLTRSDALSNNQPNINITTTKDMNGNVGVSSENHSDETDKELFKSSCPATGSPVLSLTTSQSQQNPEPTGADKKSNENFGSTKRNAVIIPPSEHISFTTCGDVKFSKTIMKTISKLAESSSNQVYVYLNKSPRSPNCKQNQVIFRVDSSTVPYKLVKTTSFFDELIAKDKTVLQFSSKQSSKRKGLSRNSLKRLSATSPPHLSNELSDSELILKDSHFLQFSPKKSPKRQGSLRNSPKRQSSTAPRLPNGESIASEPIMIGKPLLQISPKKSPNRKRQPKNSMKRYSTSPPPNLPNELNEPEPILEDKRLLQFSPKTSPKRQGISKSSLKRKSTTPPPPHLPSVSSDPETKDITLLPQFSSKPCTRIQELSRNSLTRQSITPPHVPNPESSIPELIEIHTPLLQSSPKNSPKRELSRNITMRLSTTPPHSSNDDDPSDPEVMPKNKTLLLRFSPKKSPKRELSKNSLKRLLATPAHASNDDSSDTGIRDKSLLLRFSSKNSPKRPELSRNNLKRQSTTPPHSSNDDHSDPELMSKNKPSQQQFSPKKSPKRQELPKDSLKRQSTTPPHSSNDDHSDHELITKDKTLVQSSPKKSPTRQASSRSSLKRQSTTPAHLPNEAGDLELLNAEPLLQDNLVSRCVMPEMSLIGDDGVVTSSRVVSQWTCEDVNQWLTSHGLGRFTKDFVGVNGHGLVELVQYFNKDLKILQKYLRDMNFSLSEKLKLYAALRVLHKQVATSHAEKSSLTDHASSAQGKSAPALQKNIPAPVSASSNSHVPLAAENDPQVSSSISQWTCEDVSKWLTAHKLSKFTKDFSNVDGSCLIELITSCSSASNSIYKTLYSIGFTLSELLNLSANLSALSRQLTSG